MEKNLSLEEKIGQMLMIGIYGYDVDEYTLKFIKQYKVGGIILFKRNINDTKQMQELIQKLKQVNRENGNIPLFISIDQEGGRVNRLPKEINRFQLGSKIGEKNNENYAYEQGYKVGKALKSLGVNMNLAPVADVSTNSSDFIYKRAYGKNAEETAKYVSEVIKTMNNDGIISTMKHFPGYGNNIDTHTGIAIDERPYETFETSDFLPFKSGIDVGAPTILVSHNIVKSMDENNPASLSTKIHSILRYDLGFSGIIMTDDLAMDAVKTYTENGEAAVQAVLAGNDMIISSDFKTQRQEVLNAISEGKIDEELIDMAVRRILACKYAYGIIK